MRTVKRAVALAAVLPWFAVGAGPALAAAPGTDALDRAAALDRSVAAGAALPQAAEPGTAAVQPGAAQPDSPGTLDSPDLGRSRSQVGVALTKVTPKPLKANSTLDIRGTAQNRSGHQIAGVSLRLRYGRQPISSRSQLEQYSEMTADQLPVPGLTRPIPQAGGAGGKQDWELKVAVAKMQLTPPNGTPGVYPVGVEVLNSAQQVVGGVTTFVTFMPKRTQFKPVAVGWVLPLADQQHRTSDSIFLDDRLSQEVAGTGRLNDLVTAAAAKPKTPVTWAIDPALLDDVQQIAAHDYRVLTPGAKTASKTVKKSTAASAWLAALRNATKGDPYFTLPYADPDAVALARYKMTGTIRTAYDQLNTSAVAQKALGRAPDKHYAWPPYGVAGPDTLDALAKYGLKDGGSFLMSDLQFGDLPQGGPANATTAIQTAHQGTHKTLVYDSALNDIVSANSRAAGGKVLTEQRFLAETAVIAGEAPNVQRTVVVAPDRQWNPAPGLAEDLLNYTRGATWLSETSLGKIESMHPQSRVLRAYNDDYQKYELGGAYLEEVADIGRRAARFRSIMVAPIGISYERALLRVQSAAWRTSQTRARHARLELSDELDHEMAQVHIVTTQSKRTNLAGSSGRFPVTVRNTLHDQTIRVRLVPISVNTAKLQLRPLDQKEAIIELQPGEQEQRWVAAQASGNGKFDVRLELRDAGSGRIFSSDAITVRTTGYGRLSLLITGGGLAVLFVGVGVRAIRARRRRKAEAAGDGSTGMGPAATGEPGNGFPGPGFPGSGIPPAGPPSAGASASGPAAPGASAAGASAARPAAPGPSAPTGPSATGAPSSGTSAAAPFAPGPPPSGASTAGLSGTAGVPGAAGPVAEPGLSAPGPAAPAGSPPGPPPGAPAAAPGPAAPAGPSGAREPGGLPEPEHRRPDGD
ncbi:DUF6049 family protein [Actinomadura napierensis]|uniref:Secreted protein n=1 Tax=Actinomadura napierensis TaxID=267854 RepID=A0ABN3AGS1_9ACTN